MTLENIKHIFFDVDGTLYNKQREYNEEKGSIEDAHEFFRYETYSRINQREDPVLVAENVVEDYKELQKTGTLREKLSTYPQELKDEYHALVDLNGSNGKVFVNEFLQDSSYFSGIVSNVDFSQILKNDRALGEMITGITQNLGILTTEKYKTVFKVTQVLGIPLPVFFNEKYDGFPILCAENVRKKKPSLEGFERILELTDARPDEVVYVGDSKTKDVLPPLQLGMNAVHVTWNGRTIEEKDGYFEIPTIYDLAKVVF